MSNNNSAQKRSAKRNARAKVKRTSAAKGRAAPKAVASREHKRLARALGAHHIDFNDVLNNAVRSINKGGKELETSINSPAEMIEGLKRNIGEVFKFFSYVTLLNGMIEKKMVEYTLAIDLKAIALDLIDIDNRVSRLVPMLNAKEEEAVVTECLDIATTVQNHAQELYAEIERSEEHSLAIEETISELAKEVEGDLTYSEKTAKVLSAISYEYLTKAMGETLATDGDDTALETAEETVEETVAEAN